MNILKVTIKIIDKQLEEMAIKQEGEYRNGYVNLSALQYVYDSFDSETEEPIAVIVFQGGDSVSVYNYQAVEIASFINRRNPVNP